MSFHLEGPWLTTTGKRKGKPKFRNSDEARKFRELEESWKNLQKKWNVEKEEKRKNRGLTAKPYQTSKSFVRETPKISSLPFSADPCAKPDQKVYTGTLIKGVSQMHKSNAVPVIDEEQIKEIARMRR
jgi:hypothetical protein